MTTGHPAQDSKDRSTWYVAPLVWLAIAVLSLVIAPNWNDLLAEPSEGYRGIAAAPPGASHGDPSVPAASSVFTRPSYPIEEHVQAF